MPTIHFQDTIKEHLKYAWIIPVFAFIFALVTVVLLATLKTAEYSSTIQVLVVQKYTLTDSYTASKSAEKISSNLAEVVGTSTFLDAVYAENTVDLNELYSLEEAEKRKKWKKMVETTVVPRTSILKITAFDENPAIAEELANTVANVIIMNGSEYHGAADTVTLKVVDSALTSSYPIRPNLLMNGLAAAALGAAFGLLIVLLRKPSKKGKKVKKKGIESSESDDRDFDPRASIDEAPVPKEVQDPEYSVLDVTNYHLSVQQQNSVVSASFERDMVVHPDPFRQ